MGGQEIGRWGDDGTMNDKHYGGGLKYPQYVIANEVKQSHGIAASPASSAGSSQ